MAITLSKTKLTAYMSCPEKFRLRYGLRIRPLLEDPALVEGRAIHHLIEMGLMYQDQIEDILPVASERYWETTPFETCKYESVEDYKQAQEKCLVESRKFLELIGPLKVLEVEKDIQVQLTHPFTGEVSDQVSLRGILDLVFETETGPGVLDIKTVGRTPGMPMAAISTELALYGYLLELPGFWDARPVDVGYLNLVRTKKLAIVFDKAVLGLDDFISIHTTCIQVAEAIKNSHFWKNPGMHCAWCVFRSLCHGDHVTAIQTFGHDRWEFYRFVKGTPDYRETPTTEQPQQAA